MRIAKTRSQLEPFGGFAIYGRYFNQQRAHLACVLAFAGDVANDFGFRIVMGFDFKQVVIAHTFVQRATPVQHQAFSTCLGDLFELTL